MKIPFFIEAPDFKPPSYLDESDPDFDQAFSDLTPTQLKIARKTAMSEQRDQWNTEMSVLNQNCIRVLGVLYAAFIIAVLIGGPALLQSIQDHLLSK